MPKSRLQCCLASKFFEIHANAEDTKSRRCPRICFCYFPTTPPSHNQPSLSNFPFLQPSLSSSERQPYTFQISSPLTIVTFSISSTNSDRKASPAMSTFQRSSSAATSLLARAQRSKPSQACPSPRKTTCAPGSPLSWSFDVLARRASTSPSAQTQPVPKQNRNGCGPRNSNSMKSLTTLGRWSIPPRV